MKIKFVELQNFRKLKSCRVDFSDKTTIFVGANNSGKTSAMDAIVKFLLKKNDFSTTDFTLSNWTGINEIGAEWEKKEIDMESSYIQPGIWEQYLPALDIWFEIDENEIHYVSHLIPTLDWKGGLLGVRLRISPKSIENFYKDYKMSILSAKETIASSGKETKLELWPRTMREFLEKRFHTHFTIRAHTLDPTKCQQPCNGVAMPQSTPLNSELSNSDPFKGLILVHNINAQRGFSDPAGFTDFSEENGSTQTSTGSLSSQLRIYYNTHLNPSELPDSSDLDALEAIAAAQNKFDEKLEIGFKDALDELQNMGYPGFSDPRITISTKIRPMDSINHRSAVQFELMNDDDLGVNKTPLRLPEQYNGLGYQNLISMVFKLMRFRDSWMQVGKAFKKAETDNEDFFVQPLHLVLVEEPEAHLHVQVQQVFIRKAYDVLCNNKNLKNQSKLSTQLVVSTHSGHIAHEMDFGCLRYFRRKLAESCKTVPLSTVVNLSEVFGCEDETNRFVSRYLKSTHCDLFFADAAILVEGPAERMMVPYFIRQHYKSLHERYISLLEIGGSHAHKLKPLIEHLGLTSLIITDLDSTKDSKARSPQRSNGLKTGNHTLKTWIPCKEDLDELLDTNSDEKVKKYDESFSIRVAYQCPIMVTINCAEEEEALSNTFEDALVFNNLDFFKSFEGNGLIKKFRKSIESKLSSTELEIDFFDSLRDGKKAEFALELLYSKNLNSLCVPTYISEGLNWLQNQLDMKPSKGHNSLLTNLTLPVDKEVK